MESNIILYTTEEAAKLLHCNKRVLDRKCREGKVKAAKVGRSWIIEEENLKKFINRR